MQRTRDCIVISPKGIYVLHIHTQGSKITTGEGGGMSECKETAVVMTTRIHLEDTAGQFHIWTNCIMTAYIKPVQSPSQTKSPHRKGGWAPNPTHSCETTGNCQLLGKEGSVFSNATSGKVTMLRWKSTHPWIFWAVFF